MCSVRSPLPLLVAVMLGCSWSQVLAANAWDPGENGPEKVNRLDSDLDTPVKVKLYNPRASPTKLFASCIVSDSAYVRFHKLSFPAHKVVFARYVPIAAQLELYRTSWRVVNKSSLKTSLACASYAEENASVMMYQFYGSQCRVSTVRMQMKKETCGNKNAIAVFIKSSCPEPTVQVTLTPAPGAMDISWTTYDPCHQAVKFKIDWVSVGGSDVTMVNGNVFHYRINDRLGCETLNVTVTALDSFSQPYGNPTAISNVTLPGRPPKMANLTTVRYVDHLDVTWSVAENECLRINEFVLEWKNVTSYSGSTTLSKSTYSYSITGLHACITITVSVKARYDEGAGTTNVLSHSAETLPEDPVIKTFVVDTTTTKLIEVSWTIEDYCNFIQDLNMIVGGVTHDLSKDDRSFILDKIPCSNRVTFYLIPINGRGVEFASRKSLVVSTTNTFSRDASGEDICYGCLHYLNTLPKLDKAAAAIKCTDSGYNLYRPAYDFEVGDLITFLRATLVPAADYAYLYVDLTYASSSSKWTWGGAAAIDGTFPSNWAGSHPDSSIGQCAVLSGGDRFKLKSVDCTSLEFAVCIEYCTA